MFQGNRHEINRNNRYEMGLREAEEEVRKEQEAKKKAQDILAVPERAPAGRTYDPYMPRVPFNFLRIFMPCMHANYFRASKVDS